MRPQLIKSTYLQIYKKKQAVSILKHFYKIKEISFNPVTFGYAASLSLVFSSKIEGNPIDFDTYLKYAASGMNTKSKSFREIADLIKAYEYAGTSELKLDTILKSHSILSKTLIGDAAYRGRIRNRNVGVWGSGKLISSGADTKETLRYSSVFRYLQAYCC